MGTLNMGGRLPSCHGQVCGAFDHQAGFVGATYVDCPNKPWCVGWQRSGCMHTEGRQLTQGMEAWVMS